MQDWKTTACQEPGVKAKTDADCVRRPKTRDALWDWRRCVCVNLLCEMRAQLVVRRTENEWSRWMSTSIRLEVNWPREHRGHLALGLDYDDYVASRGRRDGGSDRHDAGSWPRTAGRRHAGRPTDLSGWTRMDIWHVTDRMTQGHAGTAVRQPLPATTVVNISECPVLASRLISVMGAFIIVEMAASVNNQHATVDDHNNIHTAWKRAQSLTRRPLV